MLTCIARAWLAFSWGEPTTIVTDGGAEPPSEPRSVAEAIAVPAPPDARMPAVVPSPADGPEQDEVGKPTGRAEPVGRTEPPPAGGRPTVIASSAAAGGYGTDPRIPRPLAAIDGYPSDEIARLTGPRKDLVFVPGTQVRTAVGFVSPFPLDDAGNRYQEGAFITGRVRWRPILMVGQRQQIRLVGQLDLVSGRWMPMDADDPTLAEIARSGSPPVATDLRPVDLRELYLEWTSRVGQLRVGQMAFTWGQGLVANDGNNMDRFGDMKFGDDRDGNIQERISFATKPFARGDGNAKDVVLAVGADLVYRDPNADLTKGDLAGQAFLVVRWQSSKQPGNWIGAYAVYRHQDSANDGDAWPNDDTLEVGILDLAGQGWLELRRRLTILGAFETALIGGRTTFASEDGTDMLVLQGAAALRGYVGDPEVWLVGFDAGYASGDANPDDDEINGFEANPSYTAGLVLFPWIQGWQSARSQIRAEDRNLFGVPPNGTQYIPTEGAVTNVVFVHPKARWALMERAEIWGGPLLAASPAPIVDPFTTNLQGGSPKNWIGGNGNRRYYGTELDVGVRVRYEFRDLWFMAGLQAGVLFPGPGMRDAQGAHDGPIWGTWFRAEVRY